jgi:hypothetical protein
MTLRTALLLFCFLPFSYLASNGSLAQQNGSGRGIEGPAEGLLGPPVEMDTDLRDLPIEVPLRQKQIKVPLRHRAFRVPPSALPLENETPFIPRKSINQRAFKPPVLSRADPNFDGIEFNGLIPPDTNGDVGPDHYVQVVNGGFVVFDKEGNALAGPMAFGELFVPLGGSCSRSIDPIVNYDPLADRWIVLGFPLQEPVCIAVSKTGDPVSGGWFLYELDVGPEAFPDYPKLGVWPDAYYLSTQRGFPRSGSDVYALDRDSMLNGELAGFIHFGIEFPALTLFMLPADLDGRPPKTRQGVPPPAPFARHVDGDLFGGVDRLEIFEFKADFADPESSTFALAAELPTEPFRAVLCGDAFFAFCAEQPNGSLLETLPAWLMWRLQYRNFNSYETLVVNHTIAVDSDLGEGAGIRWYELRRRHGGRWAIFQQGTFAPQDPGADSFLHRWMGSIAMDKRGNIALGFSATSASVFPSVRYVGRLEKDTLGLLPRGAPPSADIVMIEGENSDFDRWGDYSSMSVDPEDGCRFWYTQEYIGADEGNWRTRIGAFRFSSCH